MSESLEMQSDEGSDNYSCGTTSSCQPDVASSGEKTQTEIQLSASVESSLCRRGRLRFRELQANSTAKLRLDRTRAVLKVRGTESEILAVRRKLECLGGVRKVVSTAVWCELMRTRLDEKPEQSMLQWMQLQSGCRIHIERSLQEVRLFGPDDNTKHGIELIDNFSERCVEVAIPSPSDAMPDSVVKAITDAYQVTVNVEMRQVMIYGLQDAVEQAKHEVESYLKSGTLSLVAAVDTDVDSDDDGTSSSFSGSTSTWMECPEPSSLADANPSCSTTAASTWLEHPQPNFPVDANPSAKDAVVVVEGMNTKATPYHAADQASLMRVPITGCYMPPMTQPVVGVPIAQMFPAMLVPAGMVLAQAPFQGTFAPPTGCRATVSSSPR